MKHLLYLFCFIALSCSFISCSNDDDTDWKYGEEQILAGSEWVYTAISYGGTIPDKSLSFDANGEFTLSHKKSSYNEELHEWESTTTIVSGTYQYDHPKLVLKLENEIIEAWISAQNTIYFQQGNQTQEYIRE